MNIYFKLIGLTLSLLAINGQVESCRDIFNGKQVIATGDWSKVLWSATDQQGLMSFDEVKCRYTVVIGDLKPSTHYSWKITIGNTWNQNVGCGNGNCQFKTNENGAVRFVVNIASNSAVLATETDVSDSEIPCTNPYKGETVRAVGEWNNFLIVDPSNVMTYIESRCEYSLVLRGQKPTTNYRWKVVIGNRFFACNNMAICTHETDENGDLRLTFAPKTNSLSSDFEFDAANRTPAATTRTSTAQPAVTTQAAGSTPSNVITINPVEECTSAKCPTCNNAYFGAKSVRAVGDWARDSGSPLGNWSAVEPLGLMTFEKRICKYTLVLEKLQADFKYEWKLVVDNSFKENYGN
jgi:hypothetical protein